MGHFLRALSYSRDGVAFLLKERSFRQELLLLAAALPLVASLGGAAAFFGALPWGLLVLAAEALNTAVEKTVDLCTQKRHPLAKAAKDCGSFACGACIAAFLAACARSALF